MERLHVAKRKQVSEGFPSVLQYIDFHSSVISYRYVLVMGMREDIPIYVGTVRFVTDSIISFA
jgi:hypothetical protein